MTEDERILEEYKCGDIVIINPYAVKKKKWFYGTQKSAKKTN